MSVRHWHLISYDVRDSKRLRHVAKKLEGYGERVQYSIFRCRLDKASLEKLRWELSKIFHKDDDLLVLPICPQCAEKVPIHSTGDQTVWTEAPPTFRVI